MSEENYKAIMLLHALGDTIGFKNGEWEFNYFENDISYKTSLEIVFHFIQLGGITTIDLKDWNISDDTLIHMAVAKTLLEYNKNDKNNDYIDIFKKNLIITLKEMENFDNSDNSDNSDNIKELIKKSKNKFRGVGITTITSVEKWNDENNKISQSEFRKSGGNGVTMRSLCIGAFFHDNKDLDELIEFSINTGKTTHPNPIGYLGGLSSAYFTHLALNKVDISEWPFLLMKLVESDKVLKYISKDSHDEIIGYRQFISLWKKYIQIRFKNNKPIFTKLHSNLIFRIKFFKEFTFDYDEFYSEKNKNDNNYITIGGSGVTSMLMAYDALLDAGDCWEKLIYYSMLHIGDSDTVGAIAGGLFGAMYEFKNVPEHMLKYLEKKEDLIQFAEKLHKKRTKNVL
jgi:ADP-ribosylarginine hydrolase